MMDEDELDPRIQVELEKLNSATDIINKLEIELDEANTTFRMLLNECTRRLKVHSSKHGSAIENARPYYEALDIARQAQQDCQQAAVSFQRANEVHEAAKETVALAESRFASQQPEWRFDSAWQEALNHATLRVRDAERQRADSSANHGRATARYKDAQEKVQALEQRLRRNVAKSRPYFEEKQRCNEQLAAQKEAVESLASRVARVKSGYAESLRRLEGISEEIHRKRGNAQTGGCGVREPGVGAELEYPGEQTTTTTNNNNNNKSGDSSRGTSSNRAETTKAGVEDDGRISFRSLHGRRFNPALVHEEGEEEEDCGDSEGGREEAVTDVSIDLLAGCLGAGPRGDRGDALTTRDSERACDRLGEITLGDAANGNVDVTDTSDPKDGNILAVGSNSGPVSEGGGNLLSRQPDLELTYQLNKTRPTDHEREAAVLESAANARRDSESETPAELRDTN